MKYRIYFALSLAFLPSFLMAEPSATMSFQGYSGLINTPTATLFDEGKLYIQYGNQVESLGGYGSGENYNFGVGLWKYVEVSGRLADYNSARRPKNYTFYDKDGLTDLSANIKLGIPFIPKNWFSLAVGIQDAGGAENFFHAKYAVASKTLFENINVSVGLGKSESNQGRLNGVFTGIEWQPYNWAKISLENDAADTNIGLHLVTPEHWFDSGTQLSTNLLIASSNDELADDFYYSVGLRIPLEHKVNTQVVNHSKIDEHDLLYSDVLDKNGVEPTKKQDQLHVKKLLSREGFERIKVGEEDLDTVYIELENHVYNRNQIDGIGVALGIMSTTIQHNYKHFTLVLKEREIPILIVSGNLAEYEVFLKDNAPLKIKISTDTFSNQGVIATNDENESNDFWLKPRFTFWPGITSAVGTEVGVFDASLALVSHVELPLWHGAAVTGKHVQQVAETTHFKEGEVFYRDQQQSGFQEYSFHQTFSLPYTLKNMTSFGRYRETYNYAANEVRWQSTMGNHKINLLTASYEQQDIVERKPFEGCNAFFAKCWPAKDIIQRDVLIAKYKYYNAHLNALAEVQLGQYWQQDKGVVLKLEKLFGDMSIIFTYKNTKKDEEEANQFMGIGFSIPLTPRKDYNNRYLQVRGNPKWEYNVNTLIGENHNRLTSGSGDNGQIFYNLDRVFYNNDRLSQSYIYENSKRLKEAYYQAR
jgi:hypothetical protein